jgi:hypothetical protein
MSSARSTARSPGHRHTSSADSGKFEDILQRGRGQISSESFEGDDVYFARYPNNWSKIRSVTIQLALDADSYCPISDAYFRSETIREPAAEMLGTMLLTLIGTAGNCQAVLSTNTGVASSPKGDYLSLAIGWACSSLTLVFYRV